MLPVIHWKFYFFTLSLITSPKLTFKRPGNTKSNNTVKSNSFTHQCLASPCYIKKHKYFRMKETKSCLKILPWFFHEKAGLFGNKKNSLWRWRHIQSRFEIKQWLLCFVGEHFALHPYYIPYRLQLWCAFCPMNTSTLYLA